MNNQERSDLMDGIKWSNDIIRGCPYFIEIDFLEKNNLDYILHGDDIIYDLNGESSYSKFEKVGKFKY